VQITGAIHTKTPAHSRRKPEGEAPQLNVRQVRISGQFLYGRTAAFALRAAFSLRKKCVCDAVAARQMQCCFERSCSRRSKASARAATGAGFAGRRACSLAKQGNARRAAWLR